MYFYILYVSQHKNGYLLEQCYVVGFVTETERVSCTVRTESLNIIFPDVPATARAISR